MICQNKNKDRPKSQIVTLKIKEPYQTRYSSADMAHFFAFKSEQVSIYKFMFIQMKF